MTFHHSLAITNGITLRGMASNLAMASNLGTTRLRLSTPPPMSADAPPPSNLPGPAPRSAQRPARGRIRPGFSGFNMTLVETMFHLEVEHPPKPSGLLLWGRTLQSAPYSFF